MHTYTHRPIPECAGSVVFLGRLRASACCWPLGTSDHGLLHLQFPRVPPFYVGVHKAGLGQRQNPCVMTLSSPEQRWRSGSAAHWQVRPGLTERVPLSICPFLMLVLPGMGDFPALWCLISLLLRQAMRRRKIRKGSHVSACPFLQNMALNIIAGFSFCLLLVTLLVQASLQS